MNWDKINPACQPLGSLQNKISTETYSVVTLPAAILRQQLQITETPEESTGYPHRNSYHQISGSSGFSSFLLPGKNHTWILGLKTNRLMFLIFGSTSSASY